MKEPQPFGVRADAIEALLKGFLAQHQLQFRGSLLQLAHELTALSNKEILRFVDDDMSVGTETLADAAVYSARQALSTLVERADDLPVKKVHEVWPIFGRALATAVTLKDFLWHLGANPLRLGVVYAGGSAETLAWPPIALQEKPRGPVRLLFWPSLQSLLQIAEIEVLDKMSTQSRLEEEPLAAANPQHGEKEEIERGFAFLYSSLHELNSELALLATLQWSAADVIGLMYGIDRCGLAWYPYAMSYLKQVAGRIPSLSSGEDLSLNFWAVVESPPEELNLAGMALRYILERKPFRIPLLSVVGLKKEGTERVLSCRLVANSPFLSHREMASAAKRALIYLRGSRCNALSRSDREFLEVARELGIKPGTDAPRGFWERFVAKWNMDPKHRKVGGKDLTEGHARVRWSRLMERLRNVYGASFTWEDVEEE